MRWMIPLTLFVTPLLAEIQKIKDFTSVQEKVNSTDWVVFDVNYTILSPKDPALWKSTLKKYKQHLKKHMAMLSEEEKALFSTFLMTEGPNALKDQEVLALIQGLQEDDIPVLGFSEISTSLLSPLGELPTWQTKELQQFGISFHHRLLPAKRVELAEFPPFRGTYPLYADGVLYNNALSLKGPVLDAFLTTLPEKPARVVLIDDSLEALTSAEESLQKSGIPFLGLHYLPVENPADITLEEWEGSLEKVVKSIKDENFPAGMIESENPAIISWAIGALPPNSLIIFDIGDVLIQTKDDPAAQKTSEESVWMLTLGRPQIFSLVNPILKEIISHKDPAKKMIALSRYWVRRETEMAALLKNLGISFDDPFPALNLWYSRRDRSSFNRGILVTEAPLKGPVLQVFLEKTGFRPSAIVFIDDQKEQCESIFSTAKTLDIKPLVIQYTESKKSPTSNRN